MAYSINFKEFLEKNNVNMKLFAESCALDEPTSKPLNQLKEVPNVGWIQHAFNWCNALDTETDYDYWDELDDEWMNLLDDNPKAIVEFGFLKYSIKGLQEL